MTRLTRRRLLQALPSSLPLVPLLPSLWPSEARAQAAAQQPAPLRYVVMFAGVSTGRGNLGDMFAPARLGAGYSDGGGAGRALAPLVDRDVVARTTVVSGLQVPTPQDGVVPPGGRGRPWHSSTVTPLLSGMRALDSEERYSQLGPTSDQLMADVLGGPRFRSLEYKVQASGYRDETSTKRIMSYRGIGDPNEPITSPSLAYDALFSGFVSEDPAVAAAARRKLERDSAVVGLVRTRAERLRALLGADDRRRLARHVEELAALQGRLQEIDPGVDAVCRQLDQARYAADPQIEQTLDAELCARFGFDSPQCQERVIGYAQETERGHLLSDLVHMAFACDLTRVASVMLTHAQCFMNIANIVPSGVVTDAHECGHGTGTDDDFRDMLAWHVDQFAYLVQRLRDTPEGDGTLLDRTVCALVFEGGFGFDPETNDAAVPHSSERMNALIAGGEAVGLTHGTHVDGAGRHPAQLLLRGMRALGFEGNLGDMDTPLTW